MKAPPEQSNASEDFSEVSGGDLGKEGDTPTDPTKATEPTKPRKLIAPPKRKKAKVEQVRIASINLTEPGFEALGALQKKTGLSRKELISRCVVDALTGTMNEIIVKFKFTEPTLLTELRKDIISFEASAELIREGLYSIRPRDTQQAVKTAKELTRIQELLNTTDKITEEIKAKHRLLSGLTAADHKALPEILPMLDRLRKSAEGASDKARKLARYDLVERLVRLSV